MITHEQREQLGLAITGSPRVFSASLTPLLDGAVWIEVAPGGAGRCALLAAVEDAGLRVSYFETLVDSYHAIVTDAPAPSLIQLYGMPKL